MIPPKEEIQKYLGILRQQRAERDAYWKSERGKRDYINWYLEDKFGKNGFFTKMREKEMKGEQDS